MPGLVLGAGAQVAARDAGLPCRQDENKQGEPCERERRERRERALCEAWVILSWAWEGPGMFSNQPISFPNHFLDLLGSCVPYVAQSFPRLGSAREGRPPFRPGPHRRTSSCTLWASPVRGPAEGFLLLFLFLPIKILSAPLGVRSQHSSSLGSL